MTVGPGKQVQCAPQGHVIMTGTYSDARAYIPVPTTPPSLPIQGTSRVDGMETGHLEMKINPQRNAYYGGTVTTMAVHGVKVKKK